jgi:DNA-binding transcriptional ArsR family regulator
MSNVPLLVNRVPVEIRKLLTGLNDDLDLAIFSYLYFDGERSFTDIRDSLGVSGAKLTYHLKRMQKSALVKNFYRNELGNTDFSYYAVTVFGRRFFGLLIDGLNPGRNTEELDVERIKVTDID